MSTKNQQLINLGGALRISAPALCNNSEDFAEACIYIYDGKTDWKFIVAAEKSSDKIFDGDVLIGSYADGHHDLAGRVPSPVLNAFMQALPALSSLLATALAKTPVESMPAMGASVTIKFKDFPVEVTNTMMGGSTWSQTGLINTTNAVDVVNNWLSVSGVKPLSIETVQIMPQIAHSIDFIRDMIRVWYLD
ncbi:MAG: hypothetical protein Q7S87_03450 [Agitococcus sp.]|nr:hypothetical protein [Agitococcus sp.]MDO9178692.1 hypothetical protein [Agitococcus sp.]